MTDRLARFFRGLNSNIIYAESISTQKFWKVLFLLTTKVRSVFKPLKDQTILISNYDRDLKIVVNPSKSMGSAIYWTGFHEVKELIFLHRFLKRDMVFLDIGANQGEFTIFAAKRLTAGKVFSFEPLPSMVDVLRKNVSLNHFSNVVINNYGLSNHSGVLPIFEFGGANEGLATLFPGVQPTNSTYSIELRCLDDELPKLFIDRIDFMKMDIEGAELFALQGAVKSIQKFRPLIMVEVNEGTYSAAGYTVSDVLDFFSTMNYEPFVLDKNARLKSAKNIRAFGNLIFVPR